MAPSKEFLQLVTQLETRESAWVNGVPVIKVAFDTIKEIPLREEVVELLYTLADVCVCELSTRLDTQRGTILARIKDMHTRKNAGYSGRNEDPWHNFRQCTAFGVTPYLGVLVRLSDKVERALNLDADRTLDQVNEPLTDTLMDIASYSLIAICLFNETYFSGQYTAKGS